MPKPELEKRTRRKFPTKYKLRMIAEADTCKHGKLGALLRRENIYSNQLRDWRAEFRESGAEGLDKTAPGQKLPRLLSNAGSFRRNARKAANW